MRDGRRLPSKIQEPRRIRALKEVLKGQSPSLISRKYGVARASIYNWLSSFRKGGLKALKTKLHGRRRKLTESQGRWLRNAVTTGHPSEFGFSSPVWTLALVHALIVKKWEVELSLTTADNLIWGLGLRSYVVRRARKVSKTR